MKTLKTTCANDSRITYQHGRETFAITMAADLINKQATFSSTAATHQISSYRRRLASSECRASLQGREALPTRQNTRPVDDLSL